jgi:hypothetical protein
MHTPTPATSARNALCSTSLPSQEAFEGRLLLLRGREARRLWVGAHRAQPRRIHVDVPVAGSVGEAHRQMWCLSDRWRGRESVRGSGRTRWTGRRIR